MFWIVFFALFSCPSSAEYRAYLLTIKNEKAGSERKITSTLDHIQYPGYYPLAAGETVLYSDSWMCRGNTANFTTICPKTKP